METAEHHTFNTKAGKKKKSLEQGFKKSWLEMHVRDGLFFFFLLCLSFVSLSLSSGEVDSRKFRRANAPSAETNSSNFKSETVKLSAVLYGQSGHERGVISSPTHKYKSYCAHKYRLGEQPSSLTKMC